MAKITYEMVNLVSHYECTTKCPCKTNYGGVMVGSAWCKKTCKYYKGHYPSEQAIECSYNG